MLAMIQAKEIWPVSGMRTYTSDQAMDRSINESEWQQTELRFSSDYDGAFNFTFGLFSYSRR